jgi:phospholipase C
VVLLMMENRSFDHYFGTLSGVRGFDDPNALTLSTGRSVFHQPDPTNPDGYLLPFRLDTAANSVQKIPSTSHAWRCQHESWNHGKMDNWMPAHRKADGEAVYPYVMGYYERADIPFHFALAEAFTVCDDYYCSVLGPTWPNRMVWMTGTIDPDGQHGGPITGNTVPDGGCTWTTYAERLEAAGVSWQVYAEEDDYGCNMLKTFRNFQQAKPGSGLYERGIRPQSPTRFEEDAREDKLPKVSWIVMTSEASEHPDYRPADGAAYIASKIAAIAENPEVWAKTVFILDYDENDGLFDHVPPPTPPQGTPHEFVGGLPVGAGFRVPAIVVSPWTVGGWVSSERLDHTSVLRFLEKFTGVEEPNISAWRRRTFGDFLSVFDFANPGRPAPGLPDAAEGVAAADHTDTLPKPVLPPKRQSEPAQEPGSRPRR